MKDFIRDKATGILVFNNPEKEREIIRSRSINAELKSLKEEINTLKKQVQELLATRN